MSQSHFCLLVCPCLSSRCPSRLSTLLPLLPLSRRDRWARANPPALHRLYRNHSAGRDGSCRTNPSPRPAHFGSKGRLTCPPLRLSSLALSGPRWVHSTAPL